MEKEVREGRERQIDRKGSRESVSKSMSNRSQEGGRAEKAKATAGQVSRQPARTEPWNFDWTPPGLWLKCCLGRAPGLSWMAEIEAVRVCLQVAGCRLHAQVVQAIPVLYLGRA